MKTYFYTLILLASIASCKSVEKMVEKGEYDRAFSYAIGKLQGEKNKKTAYVKGLEKAYSKLNSASLKEIEKLNASVKPENWSKVLGIYKAIENRQDRLDPLIPLVSENGYVASFDIKNYSEEIILAENNTCLYFYNNAVTLLERSERTGNKADARNAYDELKKIERYKKAYRDSEKLSERALQLGLTTIYFEIFNDLRDFHGNEIESDLMTLPVSNLDNLWYDYRIGDNGERNADYVLVVELSNINFSPERERVNTYLDSKEILIRKDKVKEKRDSVEIWVEKEVYEKVKAEVTEIYREKQSALNGRIRVMDVRTKEYIKNIPVNVLHDFKGYGCRFAGDEKALTEESKKRLDSFLEIFPSDFVMSNDLAAAFKNVVMSEAQKIRFE